MCHNRRSCQGGPTAAEKKAEKRPNAAASKKGKGKGKGMAAGTKGKGKATAATTKDKATTATTKDKGKAPMTDDQIRKEARRRQGSVVIRG